MDGFVDITAVLSGGVYILSLRGRAVFVGKARVAVDRIAKHREFAKTKVPSWFPIQGINFDQVHFHQCPAHEADALVESLISTLRPQHNETRDASAA